jgi:hypothetical protein
MAGSILSMYRFLSSGLVRVAGMVCFVAMQAAAQNSPGITAAAPGLDALAQSSASASPLAEPTLSSGVLLLLELEGRFAKAVAEGGGKAFSSWFADDAVTLNNGRPAVLGRTAIAAQAQWDSKNLPAHLDAPGSADGALQRHGIYLGPLRGPLER